MNGTMTSKRLERLAGMPVPGTGEGFRRSSWRANGISSVAFDGLKPVNCYQSLPATHDPVGASLV